MVSIQLSHSAKWFFSVRFLSMFPDISSESSDSDDGCNYDLRPLEVGGTDIVDISKYFKELCTIGSFHDRGCCSLRIPRGLKVVHEVNKKHQFPVR